jgi:hypothetical protein
MSNIINYLKCKYCGTEFYPHISFGENTDYFDFKWKCEECHKENIRPVHAFWLYPCQCEEHKKIRSSWTKGDKIEYR